MSSSMAPLTSLPGTALGLGFLVVLASLLLGDFVNVLRKLLQVSLLLGQLLLQLQELFLLALAYGEVFRGTLSLLEGISLAGLGRGAGVAFGHPQRAGGEGPVRAEHSRPGELEGSLTDHVACEIMDMRRLSRGLGVPSRKRVRDWKPDGRYRWPLSAWRGLDGGLMIQLAKW